MDLRCVGKSDEPLDICETCWRRSAGVSVGLEGDRDESRTKEVVEGVEAGGLSKVGKRCERAESDVRSGAGRRIEV